MPTITYECKVFPDIFGNVELIKEFIRVFPIFKRHIEEDPNVEWINFDINKEGYENSYNANKIYDNLEDYLKTEEEEFELVKVEKQIEDPDSVYYYGFIRMYFSKVKDKTNIISMTVQEILQENKERINCIRCGNELQQRDLLSGVIMYCKDCCG